ncbi:hypothetical protein G4O51_11995 [Candidatus Bathyarchaeota archaeon A05DMB-2]|jgi:hypothetical protein|nr:hypothetical protein [Candidatus Bathyarchaeota archaeon A05DMB-2]
MKQELKNIKVSMRNKQRFDKILAFYVGKTGNPRITADYVMEQLLNMWEQEEAGVKP